MVRLVLGGAVERKVDTTTAQSLPQPSSSTTTQPEGAEMPNQQQQTNEAPEPTQGSNRGGTIVVGKSHRTISKERRAEVKAELDSMLAAHPEVQFTYVRPYDEENGEVIPNGGCIIAWVHNSYVQGREPRDNDLMLRISTSWCNNTDVFDKVYGRYYAMKEFIAGHTTMIRLNSPGDYSSQLKELFSVCV